jgi:hypothetical protein
LLEGNYLLKIHLSPGSSNFTEYFPTYFSDHLLWQDAEFLHLADSNFYHADLSLIEIPQQSSGIGQINGNVICYLESTGGYPIPAANTEVLLYDHNMQAIAFENTSGSGNFRFENLELGTYYLMAESTGMLTEPVSVTLLNTNPVVHNIQLSLYSSGLTVINDPDENVFDVQIYPNPVNDYLFVEINSSLTSMPRISLTGISGQELLPESPGSASGDKTIRLDVSKLPKGVYVLKIISPDGRYYKNLKFIK